VTADRFALRPARPEDAPALTALARRAKAHWGYAEVLLEAWRDDLRFTPASIAAQEVWIAERAGGIAGVIALSFEADAAEVEHLWVDPAQMGEGVGRLLFARAKAVAQARRATRIGIDADPNAEGFYLRQGARRIGSVPSTPAGRTLPRLVLELRAPP
jgi:N-acetylglutamate synthase-like GNAT family acetyltransferase